MTDKRLATVLAVGGGIGLVLYLTTRAKAVKEILLTTGWNEVVYTGKRQTAEKAFASIMDYLEITYYLDEEMNWRLVTADYIMAPSEVYYISVTQDCVWTF